jgi:nucleoside-diphosphate kinase
MKGRITFTIIKPEAVQNEHIGGILNMINENGFHIANLKMIRMTLKQAEDFYAVHKERNFYKDLVNFMISGPIVVAILEKDNAVEDYRKLIGATDPGKAEEGTIRKRFGTSVEKNVIHGSDSDENARIESSFFFSMLEIYNC